MIVEVLVEQGGHISHIEDPSSSASTIGVRGWVLWVGVRGWVLWVGIRGWVLWVGVRGWVLWVGVKVWVGGPDGNGLAAPL